MTQLELLFWIVAVAGTVAGAWWLTVRPGPGPRHLAAPVALLTLALAVVLSLLALKPGHRSGMRSEVVAMARGY